MTETDLLRKYVRDPIQARWPKAYVKKWPGTMWSAGIPDTWALIEGQLVIIEGKKLENNGGNPTRLQRQNLLEADAAGAIALCVVFKRTGRRYLIHEIRTYTTAEPRLRLLSQLEALLSATVRLADRY